MTTSPGNLTLKQTAALAYVNANPQATVNQICDAAGVSQSYGNRAEFIARLIDNGTLYLLPTNPVD